MHFKKRWYASEEDLIAQVKNPPLPPNENKMCQACRMIKERTFEGELFIEEVPDRHRDTLLRVIKNFGDRATQKDPQHRLIDVEDMANRYRVTTTENQMANKLAKKIKAVFNEVQIHVSHSAEPSEVERVRAVFHHT
jgi:hypothetical protein